MYEGILKKYSLFLLLLCYMAPILYAQSDDFTTWTTMKVSHKFTSHFTMTGKMELRTKDSMKTMDRWGTSLSGSYQLFPFLKAEGGYELHHRDRGIEGWKYRHRYNLGVTGSVKWQRMKFSLRERFQQTFSDGNAENRLRSRLKVGYEPKKGIFLPNCIRQLGGRLFLMWHVCDTDQVWKLKFPTSGHWMFFIAINMNQIRVSIL